MKDKIIVVKLLPKGEIECFPPIGYKVEIQDYGTEHPCPEKPIKSDTFVYLPKDLG